MDSAEFNSVKIRNDNIMTGCFVIGMSIMVIVYILFMLHLSGMWIEWPFSMNMFSSKEGLVTKPTDLQKSAMADSVLSNKELFQNKADLQSTKNKLNWVDAVTYEDIRKLAHSNKLTKSNIMNVLSN